MFFYERMASRLGDIEVAFEVEGAPVKVPVSWLEMRKGDGLGIHGG